MRIQAKSPFLSAVTTADGIVVRFRPGPVVLDEQNAPLLRDMLDSHVEEKGPGPLVLDFGNVLYIFSAPLGVLVGLHKQARSAGKRLLVRNVAADV